MWLDAVAEFVLETDECGPHYSTLVWATLSMASLVMFTLMMAG